MPKGWTSLLVLALGAGPVAAQDRLDWGEVLFDRDRGLVTASVPGPADSVWRALKPLLVAAGVPVTLEDRAGLRLGNPRFRAVRRLAREPLARLFFCGQGLTGPNAESYHLFISVQAMVSPLAAGRSRFELQVVAEAVDVPGGRPDRVACSTTGRLEHALIERLDAIFPGTK